MAGRTGVTLPPGPQVPGSFGVPALPTLETGRGRALVDEPIVLLTAGDDGAYHASGLKFEAYSRLTNQPHVVPGTQTPRFLQVTVVVTNPDSVPMSFGIMGCTAMIRVRHPGVPTLKPAWDSRRGVTCAQAPMSIGLGPGESRDFEQQVRIYQVLGDSLSTGRYQPSIVFRHEDATYEIPAGEVDLPSNLEDVAYSARVRIENGQLRGSAVVTNRRKTPIRISYGACSLHLRAYAGSLRTTDPVWRSEAREPWGGRMAYGCPAMLMERELAPRENLEFGFRASLIEVLGDSLPDGRYWFSATVQINGEWLPEVEAGSVAIVLPREPLPVSRTARSITYDARTEVSRDAAGQRVVRAIMTAERTGPQRRARPGMPPPPPSGSLVRLSAGCPVVLYAYRDRARRNNAPRSGEPDWKSREDCGPELQKRGFYNGQPQRFDLEVPCPRFSAAAFDRAAIILQSWCRPRGSASSSRPATPTSHRRSATVRSRRAPTVPRFLPAS